MENCSSFGDGYASSLNSDIQSALPANLIAGGFTQSEVDQISSIISGVSLAPGELNMDAHIAETKEKLTETANVAAVAEKNKEKAQEADKIAAGYDPQDAKNVFKRPEPIYPGSVVFSSPIDQPESFYSLLEDKPKTKGWIDEALNWVKINMKRKYSEFVHASGNALKMDKFGNTTIHVRGKTKIIQEGSVTHFIGGGTDFVIDGSFYNHIMGQVKQMIDAEYNLTVGGRYSLTASEINLNASTITLNGKVIASSGMTASGSVELNGSVKINGVTQSGD